MGCCGCDASLMPGQIWERAEKELNVAGANPVWLAKVVAERDVEGLAEIVNGLA